MTEIRLPNNWFPRDYQQRAWKAREAGIKRFCLVWHRRAGKDDFALHSTAVELHKRVGNYWHMLPEYGQARKAIWEAVNPHTSRRRIREAFPEELIDNERDTDMAIRFKNGSMWNVVGSDSYDSLVGSPPVGVVFSEWPLAKPNAWAYLRPILAENGGWAMFIFTPRGPNHGKKTYETSQASPDWFGEILTVDDTKVIPRNVLDNELLEMKKEWGNEQGEALYNQEYYCNFESAVVGSFYGEQLQQARKDGRIGSFAPNPYLEVGTMWDLGYTDSTAIWFFQMQGNNVYFFDYYEAHGVELAHYIEVLKRRAQDRKLTYNKTMMFFPHDVVAHELITGKSRRQILWEGGVNVTVVPKSDPMDGINAVRRNFYRFHFDAIRCERGLEALSLYRREWDADTRMFVPKPHHGWESHGADALRTGVVMLPETAPRGNISPDSLDYGRKRGKIIRPGYSTMGF